MFLVNIVISLILSTESAKLREVICAQKEKNATIINPKPRTFHCVRLIFSHLFFIFLSIIIYNFISFYPIRNYFSPTFAIIFFYYGFICHLLYWIITFFFAS